MEKWKTILIVQFFSGFIPLFIGYALFNYNLEYYNFVGTYSMFLWLTPIVTFILLIFGFLVTEDIHRDDQKYLKGDYVNYNIFIFVI